MTSFLPGQSGPPEPPERSDEQVQLNRLDRRRERIYRQIQRNRAGGHKIPTWVLAAVLGLLLAGWAYLLVTS